MGSNPKAKVCILFVTTGNSVTLRCTHHHAGESSVASWNVRIGSYMRDNGSRDRVRASASFSKTPDRVLRFTALFGRLNSSS